MAVLQSGVFGLAAQFPQRYSQAVMGGQGMAGVSVAVVFTIVAWAQPGDGTTYEDQTWSNCACFGTASAFVLLCTVFYLALERSEFGQVRCVFFPSAARAVYRLGRGGVQSSSHPLD
jgi:hypothetical protein